jgi:hypothetical protein
MSASVRSLRSTPPSPSPSSSPCGGNTVTQIGRLSLGSLRTPLCRGFCHDGGVGFASYVPSSASMARAAIAFKHDVDVAENTMPFVGRRDRFAPVVAVEDGMAYVGARRAAAVVVVRTDRTGATQWESVLTEPGIREESDTTSLAATRDGFVVHAMGYIDPGVRAMRREGGSLTGTSPYAVSGAGAVLAYVTIALR